MATTPLSVKRYEIRKEKGKNFEERKFILKCYWKYENLILQESQSNKLEDCKAST